MTVKTDAEGRAIDPTTGRPTARADTDSGVQVASLAGDAGLAEFLSQHPEAARTPVAGYRSAHCEGEQEMDEA